MNMEGLDLFKPLLAWIHLARERIAEGRERLLPGPEGLVHEDLSGAL